MKKHKNLNFCLAGKNEIAIFGLKLILEKIEKKNIRVLCNSTDLGYDTWQPSLLKFARDHRLKIITLDECYKQKNLIFLSLEFDKIINPKKFDNAKLYNIHFSKLPYYRGMFTSTLPLLNNEKESGVTLHKIDFGIDTGDIIDQIKFKIPSEATARDLYFLYLDYSKKLLSRNLDYLIKGQIIAKAQPSSIYSYYSLKSINYKNIKINLGVTSLEIKNQIRAYSFREYQLPKVYDCFVDSVIILNSRSIKKSGSLISINPNYIIISSLDYDLKLNRNKNYELLESAENNNISNLEECINSGADINTRNGDGCTPIMLSALKGSIDGLKLLIKAGAQINISDYKGTTPIMYAMYCWENTGNRDTFNLLSEIGSK